MTRTMGFSSLFIEEHELLDPYLSLGCKKQGVKWIRLISKGFNEIVL